MKNRKLVLRKRLKVIILLFFVGYFSYILINQELKLNEQRADMERLKSEIESVDKVNDALEMRIEFTYTLDFIERAAREYFGWVREGQILFREKEAENR